MIARLAALLIAGALIVPAASAQRPAAPDPAALDLARLLMSRDPSLYDDADLGRFRSRIQNALLGPEEIAHIAAWLRGAEGGHFLDAWGSLRDPDHIRDRRRPIEGDLAQSAPEIFNPARALFRQRSRNLPQPAPR